MHETPVRSTTRPGALAIALAITFATLLAACSSDAPSGPVIDAGDTTSTTASSSPGTTAPGTTVAPAGTDVDAPFCDALGRVMDLNRESRAQEGSAPSGELTPEQRELLTGTYLPALTDLQAATPQDLQASLDFIISTMTSMTLPAGDPGSGQILIDLLSGGGPDHETFEGFLTYATSSCDLDDEQVEDLRKDLGGPTSPQEACASASPDAPTIDDQDRLLTVEDVTAIDGFERSCPQIPDLGSIASSQTPQAPCGGDLPDIDLATGPGASYGIGFAKLIELLARPGAADAAAFLAELERSTVSGCEPSTMTGPDGSTSTTSDVETVDLAGIDDPHLAYTARLTTTASFGGERDIPLELEVAVVVVHHGDELLMLLATGQEAFTPGSLSELTAAAVQRAGW